MRSWTGWMSFGWNTRHPNCLLVTERINAVRRRKVSIRGRIQRPCYLLRRLQAWKMRLGRVETGGVGVVVGERRVMESAIEKITFKFILKYCWMGYCF